MYFPDPQTLQVEPLARNAFPVHTQWPPSPCVVNGDYMGYLPVHLLGSEQKTALRLGSVALAIRTRRLSPNLLFLCCLLSSLNLEHAALPITRVSEGATQLHSA